MLCIILRVSEIVLRLTPVALAFCCTTLSLSTDFFVLFSSSKNSLTFSIMYFDCEVSLTPCPDRLATLCVGSSDEDVDCTCSCFLTHFYIYILSGSY